MEYKANRTCMHASKEVSSLTKKRKRYPTYRFKNGRLIADERNQRIVPTPEEAVKQGLEKAPNTIKGLFGGGILGALIAGPPGALIGGILIGWLGYLKDQEQI